MKMKFIKKVILNFVRKYRGNCLFYLIMTSFTYIHFRMFFDLNDRSNIYDIDDV